MKKEKKKKEKQLKQKSKRCMFVITRSTFHAAKLCLIAATILKYAGNTAVLYIQNSR